MAARFWSSLASRVAVPVPRPSLNPCNTSGSCIAANWRWRIRLRIFHTTFTSPIPRNSPFPFSTITTACHVASSASFPSLKAVCVSSTTFAQRSSPSSSAAVFSFPFSAAFPPLLAAASHPFMFSARIPDGPPALFRLSFFTAASTLSSVGTESSMLDFSTCIGIPSPGDGTRRYSSVWSAVIR